NKYVHPIQITGNTLVKAIAFKKGWRSSDVSQTYYFKSTYRSDSAALLTIPKYAYRGKGITTVTDGKKSDINFASGKWLGFQENHLTCVFFFNKPVMATNVTLSALMDIKAYIFLPQKVQVWGGEHLSRLKLLSTTYPARP